MGVVGGWWGGRGGSIPGRGNRPSTGLRREPTWRAWGFQAEASLREARRTLRRDRHPMQHQGPWDTFLQEAVGKPTAAAQSGPWWVSEDGSVGAEGRACSEQYCSITERHRGQASLTLHSLPQCTGHQHELQEQPQRAAWCCSTSQVWTR